MRDVYYKGRTGLCTLGVSRFKYIHMEEMLGNIPGARQIFERWMAFEPDHHGWMAYIKVHNTHATWFPPTGSLQKLPLAHAGRRVDALHACASTCLCKGWKLA